jgi:hypothetical protein
MNEPYDLRDPSTPALNRIARRLGRETNHRLTNLIKLNETNPRLLYN